MLHRLHLSLGDVPTLYTAAAAKSLQSCPTLSDPMDCSPPDSSVHGIFQARVLEWVDIDMILVSTISKIIPLHICPEVGLLDHVILLFLTFLGIAILFSIATVPLYIPTDNM